MIGALTNHLWQSTLFAVPIGLLTVAFRKNRAQVRYWLWFSASVKFFVPFALLIALGRHLEWAPAITQMAAPSVSQTFEQIAQPFSNSPTSNSSTQPAVTDWTLWVISIVWLMGFVTILFTRLQTWRQIRAVIRTSTPMKISNIEIPAAITVRSSGGMLEPGVVGWLRPVLVLPADIQERLTPVQLSAVLTHELCHVRRRDNLTSAIHMIAEAIIWFHPFVWWIGARLVDERERACDEEVLRSGSNAQVYAQGILNVCKMYQESPLRCVAGVTGSDLKKRIESILANPLSYKLNFRRKLVLAAAGVAALSVPIVIGSLNARPAQTQSSEFAAQFEVASIRRNLSGPSGTSIGTRGDRFTGMNVTLMMLLQYAYRPANGAFLNQEVIGGPRWIDADRYDVQAKLKSDARKMPPEQIQVIAQTLLKDRFQLKAHVEMRNLPVYNLVVLKNRLKIALSSDQTPPDPRQTFTRYDSPGQPTDEALPRGAMRLSPGSITILSANSVPISQFVGLLQGQANRRIIDETGLSGLYDIHLQFSREATPVLPVSAATSSGPESVPVASNPSDSFLFSAIQELGLKLEAAKAPVEVLVIDSVNMPSEN